MRTWLAIAFLAAAAFGLPRSASAQYKNLAFGLDAGGMAVTRSSVLDSRGMLPSASALPNRMAYGERLGGEFNFKLHTDHWWFSGRINLALYQYARPDSANAATNIDVAFDNAGATLIGNLFGLSAVLGPRYYILTDRIRPYVQIAVSFEHLFIFNSNDGVNCDSTNPAHAFAGSLCQGTTLGNLLVPHTNLFAAHGQFGVEFIVQRDLGLAFFGDYQRWLVLNGPGNNVFLGGFGVIFYD